MKVLNYKNSIKSQKTDQLKYKDGVLQTDSNGNPKYKYDPIYTTDDSGKKCISYTNFLEVTFIPEEGSEVPKLLSIDNLNAMKKEAKANDKPLQIADNTYTLKRSNLFTVVDADTGEEKTLLSAFYMPTYTPKPSTLSF